ncbi:MAG: hypothetical protein ACD_30C00112G0048 [uncultured bacterium]|uniref:RNA-binding protein KhpA n=4 Tax=Candidatus Daviesiibacteriota TaxID=1752718 RepID=A0A0G0EYC6_9BACT|nr:MAG: hypothetical protein ACD_30C00112G0048 [uncultured bacterium]KKQ10532.1 MAG: hypothetical protein US19_C0003G0027 [Candidatus Daviesbacteria bacterium GW2011_GWB1_36_5]KKQ15275.1 MAG: hypothetical protein US28_C0019G0008 [Candidatus Daviesbacteria bacterium GW2011_GWA1_36_8]OGE17207.1 MAG: hypothetical protein A2858_00690 [Candidatus Daviesbacteria bacterium RIFCSPHIGHO2_01_FULL_36_37]OGE35988.1 MAG: hypothetical protein A3E66_01685 [Candidatus Daviesbacteria bacterium RIFCSPHIGHO2_12_F
MKDLVEYIVKSLVTKPDGVSVEETNSEEGVNLLLKVDPEDMGLVIGKAGQTIKAIRRLVLIRAMADNIRVNLELNDPEGGRRSGNQEESNESEGTEEPKDEEIENPEKAEDAEEPKAEETVEPEK